MRLARRSPQVGPAGHGKGTRQPIPLRGSALPHKLITNVQLLKEAREKNQPQITPTPQYFNGLAEKKCGFSVALCGNCSYRECHREQEPIFLAISTLWRGRQRPSGACEAYNPNPSLLSSVSGSLRIRGANVGRSDRTLRLHSRAWEGHRQATRKHIIHP